MASSEVILRILQHQSDVALKEKQLATDQQLGLLQMLYAKEQKDLEAARNFSYNALQDKKRDYAAALAVLNTLGNVPIQDITEGAGKLRDDILQGGQISISAMNENIATYDRKLAAISEATTELRDQQHEYNDIISQFWGENKILQQAEYEELMKYGKNVLKWEYEGAGARGQFMSVAPEVRAQQAHAATKELIASRDLDKNMEGAYQVLQTQLIRLPDDPQSKTSVAKGADPESWDDMADRFEYYHPEEQKKKRPNAAMIEMLSNYATDPNPESFLMTIRDWPAEKGGKEVEDFLRYHPSLGKLYESISRYSKEKSILLREGGPDAYKGLYNDWHKDANRDFHIDDAFKRFHFSRQEYSLTEQSQILEYIAARWNNGKPVDILFEDWYFTAYGDPNAPGASDRIKKRYRLGKYQHYIKGVGPVSDIVSDERGVDNELFDAVFGGDYADQLTDEELEYYNKRKAQEEAKETYDQNRHLFPGPKY